MLEPSLGIQNVDRRDTRFERQDRPLDASSDIRHALEAHRHAADDLSIPPQQPTAKVAVPKYFKHRDHSAMRVGSLGGDCRSIGKHLTFAAFSDDGLNRRKSDGSLNWDRLSV
jgi:hypothetical protein